ncbi:MAG TPA: hypothetical protein VFT98_14730, partial [Myxococcota bacterium]|nr:hypothetical protein [Myxococcota bacterium]
MRRRSRLALAAALCVAGGCSDGPPREVASVCEADKAFGKVRVQGFLDCMAEYDWEHGVIPAGWASDANPQPRLSGPMMDHRGYTVHQRVRVHYSPDVVRWMTEMREAERTKRAVKPIAVGSEIVKAMYVDDPSHEKAGELDGLVYMKRTDEASRDGWFWGIWFRKHSPTFPKPFYGFAGAEHGFTFCLTCHASTDNDQLTFAHAGNLLGDETVSYTLFEDEIPFPKRDVGTGLGPHGSFAIAGLGFEAPPAREVDDGIAYLPLRIGGLFPLKDPQHNWIPGVTLNDFVAPAAGPNPSPHISSDACQYCHDVALLQNGRVPAMMRIDADAAGDLRGKQYNLSPFGEWNASLMAMAARDPVFLAQLEYETQRFPEDAERIADTCLGCHAPLGARELKRQGGTGASLSLAHLYEEPGGAHAGPAALARDGVTCVACHRMSPEGLGTDASFNAGFSLEEEPVIYGPFANPKLHAMQHALGLEPREGAHLRDSGLCGSCHVVMPKVLGEGKPWSQAREAHEQTTYVEWRNSTFGKSGRGEDTCQGCHMAGDFRSPETGQSQDALHFRIANVQGPGFPHQPNRASDELLALEERAYRRHTLTGINLFTTELFCQSGSLRWKRGDLGVPLGNQFERVKLSSLESLRLARERTAQLAIAPLRFDGGALVADVTVTSLAGHKLPTGVHFRRAFLDFRVMKGEQIVWRSGATNELGELLDRDGRVLESEHAKRAEQLQPDHREIAAPEEVQIYEERYVAPNGELTTSFLSLAKKVKDNRILPNGWNADSEDVRKYEMAPVGVADPESGRDVVTYRVPAAAVSGATHVEARLTYQALPPYYVRERSDGQGNEARKLKALLEGVSFQGLAT